MILIGCPIKDRAWALPHWYEGIAQNVGQLDIRLAVVLTPSADNTEELLKERRIEILWDDEEGRPVQQINHHHWQQESYDYMARLRNRLVEHAIELDADYFFSLDSDIVLTSGVLTELLNRAQHWGGVIAPAVNMVMGNIAWNTMSWSDPRYPGGMVNRDRIPTMGKVDIVMAAMLLDRSAMECRWAGHQCGEDVGFCLDATQRLVPRWWLPDLRCQHMMTPVYD